MAAGSLAPPFGTDTIPGTHNTPSEMWTEEYQVEYLRLYLDIAAQRPIHDGDARMELRRF